MEDSFKVFLLTLAYGIVAVIILHGFLQLTNKHGLARDFPLHCGDPYAFAILMSLFGGPVTLFSLAHANLRFEKISWPRLCLQLLAPGVVFYIIFALI